MELYTYSWKCIDITDKNNYHTELRMYCLNSKNENVCVRIEDYKTRLTLEFVDKDYLINNFYEIKKKISDFIYNEKDKNEIKLVYKRKLYGCNIDEKSHEPKKFPFLELRLSSRIGLSYIKKNIENGVIKLNSEIKFHEKEANSDLQFISERKFNCTGWFTLNNWIEVKKNEKETSCVHEYFACKQHVYPSEKNDPIDMTVLAFDIEAKCKNISENPGKDINDCVFQISCVFFKTISNYRECFLLSLGNCDEIENVTTLMYKTEKDLILSFSNLIKIKKPNIITGYNILAFDFEFLINRVERNMCLCEFTSFGFTDSEGLIKSVKWFSKAYQNTEVKYIEVEGILIIDLIEVIRKDYKLDSYSLNYVSNHFLENNKKDDVSFEYLMDAYDSFLKNTDDYVTKFTKVGKYCVKDSILVNELFKKLDVWLSLSEMSKTTSTNVMAVHLNGQQKRVYNQVYYYCYHKEIVVESNVPTNDDFITGAYVFDPVSGKYKYVVSLDFESLYPTIIIAYNLDYTTMIMNNEDKFLKDDNITTIQWEDHINCEHDPQIIEKKRLINLIENTTDVTLKKKFLKQKNLITKNLKKTKTCKKHKYKFLKENYYGKGVLPTIIQNLLNARKEVKKTIKILQKSSGNESLISVLEKRQLSYKISANSMYGATGVKSGALPLIQLAMCVTYIGRESIKKSASIIKQIGGTIIYGDTDSNYVTFKTFSNTHSEKCKELWNKSIETAEIVSSHFPNPMRIEFEEAIYQEFLILTKKRYMYLSCDQYGNNAKFGQKGVLLARRDTSNFIKNVYEKAVMDVFNDKTKTEMIQNVMDKIQDLFKLNIDVKNLAITKSVNDYNNQIVDFRESDNRFYMGNYKLPKLKQETISLQKQQEFFISRLPAQVQLDIKMKNRNGGNVSQGNRILYVVLDKTGFVKQSDKIEDLNYYLKHKEHLKIDNLYQIERLIPHITELCICVYHDENFVEKNLNQFFLFNKSMKELKNLFKPNFLLID